MIDAISYVEAYVRRYPVCDTYDTGVEHIASMYVTVNGIEERGDISQSYAISLRKTSCGRNMSAEKNFKLALCTDPVKGAEFVYPRGDSSFRAPLKKARYSISRNFRDRTKG